MTQNLPISNANQKLGVTGEDLDDGRVILTLDADESFHNEVGFVHGGVAMFLLDGAMGRCCGRAIQPGDSCATVQISVQFLTKAVGTLVAEARVTRMGRSIAFLEGECRRADGGLVARAQGTWAIQRQRSD